MTNFDHGSGSMPVGEPWLAVEEPLAMDRHPRCPAAGLFGDGVRRPGRGMRLPAGEQYQVFVRFLVMTGIQFG
ncbi:hypothetical protein AL755_09525 [Arthrobacter sp. ERGS1:01]|nr:hypothetical protein AL755_09525 [Arthrobacter sp. ERGS1:01]